MKQKKRREFRQRKDVEHFLLSIADAGRDCGGALYGEGRFDFSHTNDTAGRLISSFTNSTASYAKSLDCWWTIIAGEGTHALLKVLRMTIPDVNANENDETDRCQYGFIKVF